MKQKYTLIGICPFTCRAIAGANKIHQVIEEGHKVVIEKGG
jgi:hypothetical protein